MEQLKIEPFYALLSTSLLSYYPDNTKISISEYDLIIRNPSIYQGMIRWGYGESRCEIPDLLQSIQIALLVIKKNKIYLEDVLFNLYNGLNKLKLCYISDTAIKSQIEKLETYVQRLWEKKNCTIHEMKYNDFVEHFWKLKELTHINGIMFEIKKLFMLGTIKINDKIKIRQRLVNYLLDFINLKNTYCKEIYLKNKKTILTKKLKLK